MLTRVADVPSRSRLRSSTSSQLVVRPSHLVTIGDRSFTSAGPRLWNSLPDDVTAATARVWTQTENTSILAILSGCYLVACLWCFLTMTDLAVTYLGHLKNLYLM